MDDNIKNLIQNYIDSNEVCLFMKGTPDAPQCGFSMAVTNMLKLLEVNFQSVMFWKIKILEKELKFLVTGLQSLNYILKKNLWVAVISSKKCTKTEN